MAGEKEFRLVRERGRLVELSPGLNIEQGIIYIYRGKGDDAKHRKEEKIF